MGVNYSHFPYLLRLSTQTNVEKAGSRLALAWVRPVVSLAPACKKPGNKVRRARTGDFHDIWKRLDAEALCC